MARFRIFFDMDGVLVDFERYMRERNVTAEVVKRVVGAYQCMLPIAGALDGIRKIASIAGQFGGEVWLATKPPTGVPHAYGDKVQWVLEYLPELRRRIILTHDKGLLGGPGDYLVDDRPWRANCGEFRGTLIQFAPHPARGLHPGARFGVDHWDALVGLLPHLMRTHCDDIDDINVARALLRLGPLGAEAVRPEAITKELHAKPPPTHTTVFLQVLPRAPQPETIMTTSGDAPPGHFRVTRPAHGGYPGEVRREGEHAIADLNPFCPTHLCRDPLVCGGLGRCKTAKANLTTIT